MSNRSLRLSTHAIELTKMALQKTYYTQENLAEKAYCSRATVYNFLNGKPVDRRYFIELCEKLQLNWQEIVYVDNGALPASVKTTKSIAKENAEVLVALFKDIRSQLPPDVSHEVVANLAIAALSQSKEY